MAVLSNAHTHTTFCDGKNTAEEMVQAAIAAGFQCLGFSGHCQTPVDPDFDYSNQLMEDYRREINRLKDAYQGQLDIVLGLEWDYYGKMEREQYQYIIGSAHYVKSPVTDVFYTVDYTYDRMEACIRDGFGGDPMELAKAYYSVVTDIAERVKPDILGHFDLLKKLNEDGRYFDEHGAAYRRIAQDALERIVEADPIIEVNSGAIYRGYRTEPYPAPWMLEIIRELKGRVTISSDSHDVGSIHYQFEEMEGLLKQIGFKEIWVLSKKGFQPQAI